MGGGNRLLIPFILIGMFLYALLVAAFKIGTGRKLGPKGHMVFLLASFGLVFYWAANVFRSFGF